VSIVLYEFVRCQNKSTHLVFLIDLVKLLTYFIANMERHIPYVIYVGRSFDNNMIHYLSVIWKAPTACAR